MCPDKNLYTNVHRVIFIIARKWPQPKWPLTMDKQNVAHPYNTVLLGNKSVASIGGATWMNSEHVRLSESSQTGHIIR